MKAKKDAETTRDRITVLYYNGFPFSNARRFYLDQNVGTRPLNDGAILADSPSSLW